MTDFMALVSQMREWQRYYWRTRAAAALEKCRRLERQVDAMIDGERQQTLSFAPQNERKKDGKG